MDKKYKYDGKYEWTLSDIMEFGHVVEIMKDGTVRSVKNMHAPDSMYRVRNGRKEGFDERVTNWEPFTYGYTSQYGYKGAVLASNESIGSSLEKDLMATPGIYVVVEAYGDEEEFGDEPDGWLILKYKK